MRFRTALGGWPTGKIPNGPFRLNRNSPQARGLVAWWPALGSPNTPTLRDYVGRGLHGTLGTGANRPAWIVGEQGYVLSFDGGDYVNVGTSNLLNIQSQFTIAAWINVTAGAAGDDNIYDREVGNSGMAIQIINGNLLRGWVGDGVDWLNASSGAGTIVAGQWHHVVATHTGTNIRIYIDGIFQVQTAQDVPGNMAGATSAIGAKSTLATDFFYGSLSELRIYDLDVGDAGVRAMWDQETRREIYQPVRRVWAVKSPVTVARRIFITHC